MGFMDAIGFGKQPPREPKKPKFMPAETSIIVDPSLGAEKHVPLESTYSADRLKAMAKGLSELEGAVAAAADAYHEKLERLESAEAQGEKVHENLMSETRDQAMTHGNMLAALRAASGEAPSKIAAAIERLQAASMGSSAYGKMKISKLIDDLRELLV